MTRYPKRNFEEYEDGHKVKTAKYTGKYTPKLGELQSEHWAPSVKPGDDSRIPVESDHWEPTTEPSSLTATQLKGILERHPTDHWDWDPRTGGDPREVPSNPPISHTMADALVSVREKLLREGADLTGGARNIEYGEPIDNLTMTGKLKAVFHAHMRRHMGPAEKEAIDMVLTKLGRLGRGAIKRDTYMDAAVYMAMAYEVAVLEQEPKPGAVPVMSRKEVRSAMGTTPDKYPG